MKYIVIVITISIIFASCAVKNIPVSERVNIQYYLSTTDYNNKNLSELVYTKIRETGTDFIRIHGFFDKNTTQNIKDAKTSWALTYNDINYINMRYSDNFQNSELYAKLNIEGKICALFINDKTSKKLKHGGMNHGLGLAGVLVKESNKWGKNWKDAEGNKNKILTVNTEVIDTKHKNGYKNAKATLLTKKNFNNVLLSNYSKEDIDNFSFEDVVKIINDINASKS